MVQPVNDAESYGVRIAPAEVGLGETYWRVTRVHHLTPAENRGGHHLFLDVLDEYGQPAVGTRLRIAWEGGEEELEIEPTAPGEPGAVFPLGQGQVCSVEVLGLPSDRVLHLHTEHPDEEAGNSLYHHSFYLVWQKAIKKVFAYYVLFGPPDHPQTQANLIIALGYILRFKPAFGFKVEEAALAERVTIIGGPDVIPVEAQERLEEAGCWVYRIEGDSRAIDRVLTDLLKQGILFPE
ncbi:MAG: hypothetical protein H5T60_09015 [Anaerolineae bacterium]|nr:hypothetical protein [Anaerolineae bacterium]